MKREWQRLAGRCIDRFVYPLVPKTYRLALQYFMNVRFMKWEPEVLHIKDFAHRGVALDIGANIGLWTYAMAKSGFFKEIFAFEPNAALTMDLLNAHLNGVHVVQKAVSSEVGSSHLRIPKQGKVLLNGWATLENRVDLVADKFQILSVDTIRLDDLNLTDVGFVKIDVEGHELRVLEGGRMLLSVCRPACILECRERNHQEVEEFFYKLGVGYELVDTRMEYDFDLSPGNIVFVAR